MPVRRENGSNPNPSRTDQGQIEIVGEAPGERQYPESAGGRTH